MKEKDIERIIDNMIIEGLIKEGEQDNADFEAALRNMSEEDFLAMIYEARPEQEINVRETPFCGYSIQMEEECSYDCIVPEDQISLEKAEDFDTWDETVPESAITEKRQRKPWRIWLTAAVSAAAVLAAVLIPAYRSMNARVCESALVACEACMLPRSSVDLLGSDISEIKEALPELEADYNAALNPTGSEDYYAPNLDVAGWDLAIAYLRLGERSKAKDVLTELASSYSDNEFGAQCRRIADIL